MAKIKNTDNTKCWQGFRATGTLTIVAESIKSYKFFFKF